MRERFVDLPTRDGAMTTLIVHPERGGPHPTILFLMDAAGVRDELRDMARRLATSGYYVMFPNLYYRSDVAELPAGATYADMSALMQTITMEMVMQDCDALLETARSDRAARTDAVGAVGYCMSGQYAVNVAARHPQVAAAASIHGVRLVTEAPDSPHLMMQASSAGFYFGCAELDPWAPLEMVRALQATVAQTDVDAEVEILPGVDHGFVFPSRDVYDKLATETHWERLLELFGRKLALR